MPSHKPEAGHLFPGLYQPLTLQSFRKQIRVFRDIDARIKNITPFDDATFIAEGDNFYIPVTYKTRVKMDPATVGRSRSDFVTMQQGIWDLDDFGPWPSGLPEALKQMAHWSSIKLAPGGLGLCVAADNILYVGTNLPVDHSTHRVTDIYTSLNRLISVIPATIRAAEMAFVKLSEVDH